MSIEIQGMGMTFRFGLILKFEKCMIEEGLRMSRESGRSSVLI